LPIKAISGYEQSSDRAQVVRCAQKIVFVEENGKIRRVEAKKTAILGKRRK
jgi:hypothetical protein